MKKNLFLILLLLLVPIYVKAETIKVGNNNYSIENIINPCTKANLVLDRFDEKGAVCLDPADGFTAQYRIDADGNKKEFTNQEYLDYYNTFGNPSYVFYGDNNIIAKISGYTITGYLEVPYDKIDNSKVYTIITDHGNGNYSYTYTDEPSFVFDPALKYYEQINLEYPKDAEVKTDGSITYYKCNTSQICTIESDPKPEEILNYYVQSETPYKEEKVATIDNELFEKIKFPKAEVKYQNYLAFKLPNKDIYYLFYEEETTSGTTTKVYTHDGKLIFENVDTFGIINEDLIYTIKENNITIYNTNKEVLKNISGEYFFKLYNSDNKVIFGVDDNFDEVYEIKKVESKKEEIIKKEETTSEKEKEQPEPKPVIDIINPDTGDNIINSFILGGISILGILLVTKHKRKEN